MPLSLDRSAPRHQAKRKDPALADTDYLAGYQTAIARFQRVIRHPASRGNERVAIDLLAHGLPADQAIAMLCEQAPLS